MLCCFSLFNFSVLFVPFYWLLITNYNMTNKNIPSWFWHWQFFFTDEARHYAVKLILFCGRLVVCVLFLVKHEQALCSLPLLSSDFQKISVSVVPFKTIYNFQQKNNNSEVENFFLILLFLRFVHSHSHSRELTFFCCVRANVMSKCQHQRNW